jgi:hypothetical protein
LGQQETSLLSSSFRRGCKHGGIGVFHSEDETANANNNRGEEALEKIEKRRKLDRVIHAFRRRWIFTPRKIAMNHERRRENSCRRSELVQ